MDKSKKVLLISLVPACLTLLFILYVLVPTIQEMDKTYKNLDEEKLAYNEAQSQLSVLRQNKELTSKIKELNTQLSDFDYKFPSENDLAIFLVDLEKYAKSYNVKVISLSSQSEKPLKIEDPKQNALDEKNKKKSKRGTKKTEEMPVQLSEMPITIDVIGYYPDIVKFINFLESYQRQVVISGIKISNAKDEKNPTQDIKPKLEMNIKSKVYTVVEQELKPDKSNEEKS